MNKEQSSKVEQEPVAYWIPKADQFCKADATGRPFAKAWKPLYDKPFNAEELQKENKELKIMYSDAIGQISLLDAKLRAALVGIDNATCPTCGEDGGTTCGAVNCGLLEAQEPDCYYDELKADYDEIKRLNLDWIKENAPGGWINELRKENSELKEAANSYKVVRDTLTARLNQLEEAAKLALDAVKTAQGNIASCRPEGSSDARSSDYDHDAFMWDHYGKSIAALKKVL